MPCICTLTAHRPTVGMDSRGTDVPRSLREELPRLLSADSLAPPTPPPPPRPLRGGICPPRGAEPIFSIHILSHAPLEQSTRLRSIIAC